MGLHSFKSLFLELHYGLLLLCSNLGEFDDLTLKIRDLITLSISEFFYMPIKLFFGFHGLVELPQLGHRPCWSFGLEAEALAHLLFCFSEVAVDVEAVRLMESVFNVQFVLFHLDHGLGHLDAV